MLGVQTCHVIDDTAGVQGLGLMAPLNHFVCRRSAARPTCVLACRRRWEDKQSTLTTTRRSRFAWSGSRSSRRGGGNGREVVAGSPPLMKIVSRSEKQIKEANELGHTKTISAAVMAALRSSPCCPEHEPPSDSFPISFRTSPLVADEERDVRLPWFPLPAHNDNPEIFKILVSGLALPPQSFLPALRRPPPPTRGFEPLTFEEHLKPTCEPQRNFTQP